MKVVRRLYESVPKAWRLFPMLMVAATFLMIGGFEALVMDGSAYWPPIVGDGIIRVITAVYMSAGSLLLMAGMTRFMSEKHGGGRVAFVVMLGGMWAVWSSIGVVVVALIADTLDEATNGGHWGAVFVWCLVWAGLSTILATVYLNDEYAAFRSLRSPRERSGSHG